MYIVTKYIYLYSGQTVSNMFYVFKRKTCVPSISKHQQKYEQTWKSVGGQLQFESALQSIRFSSGPTKVMIY